MKWFRFYHEFIDDPKIAMMSDSDQLLWVKALCLASENEKRRGQIELTDEEICWKLRISLESWKHAVDKFRAKGMIEHCENGYRITNWDKRQFASDSSAERVAKHRDKKAKKSPPKRSPKTPVTKELHPCNVTVTPSDTDTESYSDTDPDQEIGVLDTLYLSNADEPEKKEALLGNSSNTIAQQTGIAPKTSSKAATRSRYEYNSVARFERNFSQPQYPWTGNRDFEEWVGRQWNLKEKPTKTTIQTHILNCERNDLEKIELYWRNYQEETGSGDRPSQDGDTKKQILKELQRLNMLAGLSEEWQERTGVAHFKELSPEHAAEYLAYLRSKGGRS